MATEPLTALCSECKCCLASGTHCFVCHSKKKIKVLCGCGKCSDKVDDFKAREVARAKRKMLEQRIKEQAA